MPHADATDLLNEFEHHKTERSGFDNLWEDVAENLIPRRADFQNQFETQGLKRTEKIFDTTAGTALNRFASGLHSMLTPEAIPWFYVEPIDPKLAERRDIRIWLDEVNRRMFGMFNSPSAAFHPRAHEYFIDQGAFGWSVMFIGDRPGVGPFYQTFFIGDCYVAQDDIGVIDTMYRRIRWTGRQAVLKFGEENLPDTVKQGMEKNPTKKFEFIHVVKPRTDRAVGGFGSLNMPWMSVYISKEGKEIVSESGFQEFPFLTGRWTQTASETYGRGPGVEALPDIKMLHAMMKTNLKGLQKIVDPPLMVPDDGALRPVRTSPGGLNYYRAGIGAGDNAIIRPIATGGRPDLGLQGMNDVRTRVRESFFMDIFELPGPEAGDGDVIRMSATEVATRQRQRLQVMGPITSRQQNEFLGPLISRTATIMARNGMLPPTPEILRRQGFRIKYVNPLAIAQRSAEVGNITQTMQSIAPFAQIRPEVLDRFNADLTTQFIARTLRFPEELMLSDEQLAEHRQQQAEAAARAREAEQGQQFAAGFKDITEGVENVLPS